MFVVCLQCNKSDTILNIFLLTGVFKHTQTLCRTLLTDVASSRDQLEMQSRLVSFGSVGFIVGPVVGGHMAEMKNGFHYVCCIVMLLFLINFGKHSEYTLLCSSCHVMKLHIDASMQGWKCMCVNMSIH